MASAGWWTRCETPRGPCSSHTTEGAHGGRHRAPHSGCRSLELALVARRRTMTHHIPQGGSDARARRRTDVLWRMFVMPHSPSWLKVTLLTLTAVYSAGCEVSYLGTSFCTRGGYGCLIKRMCNW